MRERAGPEIVRRSFKGKEGRIGGAVRYGVDASGPSRDGNGDEGPQGRPGPGPRTDRAPLPGGEACGSCGIAREYAAEKARLAAWLAHELRTPLNCVLGYAELLCDQLEAPDQGSALADARRVRELALHQLTLLDDVLDLARLEHGGVVLRIEPVDAVRVLEEVAASTLPLVRRSGNRILLTAEGPMWVLADETRLRQVLLNLVSNAAKFTTGGFVTLDATTVDGSTSLHVSDTGCGMTSAEAGRLFRPFRQANASVAASHGGSGLGLAISKELCERMGGTIVLRSSEGEGTTFTVILPATPGPPARP